MRVSIQLGVAALLIAGQSQAGIYVEQSQHDFTTGKTAVSDVTYLQGGKMRTEHKDGKHVTIFKDDTMIQIDRGTKTYEVLDKAGMARMAGQMNNAFAKMKEKMAAMPPEQRAQMEKMFAQMGAKPGSVPARKAPVIDFVEAGGSGTAAGRSCHLWKKTVDGVAEEQFCVASSGSLPGYDEAIKTFEKMSDFFGEMRQAMQAQGGAAGGIGSIVDNEFIQQLQIFKKMNGFPVATRRILPNGKLESTEDVMTEWQERSIPAAQFEIPAGYTRKEMRGLDKEAE